MSKKQFKISPKVWPKEYTFEEFKRLNPNINENVLINYYNKYLQEYAENYSRHIKYFNDNKNLLANNLNEVKNKYSDTQYFLKMYYGYHDPTAAVGAPTIPFTPSNIDGLIEWYDAVESTKTFGVGAESSRVQKWESKVGSNFLKSGSGAFPEFDSTKGALIFDNPPNFEVASNLPNVYLEFETPPSLGAFTMFFTLSLRDLDQYHGLFLGDNGAEGMYFFGPTSDMFFDMELNDGVESDSMTIGPIENDLQGDVKTVVIITKDAAENAKVNLYINGVNSFENADLDENILFTPVRFGQYNGANRSLHGDVYEFGIYNRFLGDSDRKQLYYYLGIKHNIPGYDGPSELKPYNWPHGGDTYPI